MSFLLSIPAFATGIQIGGAMTALQVPYWPTVGTTMVSILANRGLGIALHRLMTPENMDTYTADVWSFDHLSSAMISSAATWKLTQLALHYFGNVALPPVPRFLATAATISVIFVFYLYKSINIVNKGHIAMVNQCNAHLQTVGSIKLNNMDWTIAKQDILTPIETAFRPIFVKNMPSHAFYKIEISPPVKQLETGDKIQMRIIYQLGAITPIATSEGTFSLEDQTVTFKPLVRA
jgi:hypothetical protein